MAALWLIVALAVPSNLCAQVEPERNAAIAAKSFRHHDLEGEEVYQSVDRLPLKAAADARERLRALEAPETSARLDALSGRFVTLTPVLALIPGTGEGNTLRWSDFEKAGNPDPDGQAQAAYQQFLRYLRDNQQTFGVDVEELSDAPTLTALEQGELIQIYAPRQFDGVPVRGSYVSGVVRFGNLILTGAHKWGDRGASSGRPQLSEAEAAAAAYDYVGPDNVTGTWGEDSLVFLTLFNGNGNGNGNGYRYQLAWSIKTTLADSEGTWETLVDAHDGEILAHEDRNHYAEAKGGVYPVTNDGINPDGVEQAGWPMPFAEVGSAITDTGGNYNLSGSQTARLYGPYVNMADQCGTESLTQSGGIDWGTSGGDDCTTPGFGGAGNTHASRSGFYELNRTKEMARGWLPSNGWLQNRLTSNMNINNTCNAFWNGSTVNFYRSGGGCSNTGEIAGVFVHEWGHGMDDNDANPSIASPSGEGIADIYTALRLNTSCIGRNFRSTVCSGNGDPCLTCTGVRDIDYLKRQSGQPHDYSWSNANCGGSVHCVGGVYSEAVWSLWKRELQQAPYNYANNRAHEITNRLTYLGGGAVGTWFSGGPPFGGCGSSGGYLNFLSVDDTDGNLNNGTPHMTAIFNAFNDQEIACNNLTVQDSGCSMPASAPNVTASGLNNTVNLSWGSVSGATSYQIFRAEGIFGCNFGKVKVGSTTGTSFSDTDLQNGRDYSYTVIPIGGNNSCMGPSSACDTVQPASGPECVVDADCDDGQFCNGAEVCNAGSCGAGSDPCPGEACDEAGDVCLAGCVHFADFEGGAGGWTNGADTCTTGSFVVGVPDQVIDTVVTQVGGGNPGSAYYTQPNTGGVGTDDVDGGTCEALSPVVDASAESAVEVKIDYYHGQRDAGDDPNDGFSIEVLNNGIVVDTLASFGDVQNSAAWTNASTIVNNPGNIQIRVRATDAPAAGDLVEGGIDNVSICASGPPPGCTVDADCDNGVFCDGAEVCNAGTCESGTPPSCDDGVSCTVDSCNTGTDSCDNTPDDSACDNGLFCDGAEVCNATLGCQDGPDPCSGSQTCNETNDVCEGGGGCSHSADFESGADGWTNGADTCTTGSFVVGTPDATTWQVGGGNPGQAFYTQPNGGGLGTDDVDGGTCEALSPSVDCAGQAAALVSLDYFHGQRDAGDDPNDGFTIEVLNNGVVVDTIVNIGDVTNNPAWTNVSTTVLNPGSIQLRVRATDAAATGDIVEGGIDNVSITPTSPPSCTVDDDLEGGTAGWFNDAASTCSTGAYVEGNPTNATSGYQITGSHSGTNSIFTAVNTSAGVDDVDGGNCILGSPSWNVTNASTLSVWYWFGQRDAGDDPSGDFNILEYSTNGGSTWQTLASNGDSTINPAWTEATASIPAGSTVQLRMQCSDGPATGDLVECGLDDVSICE